MKLPKILLKLSKVLKNQNAKAIIVGGSVRDHFLKLPIKDYDVEVYGLSSLGKLEKILSRYGSVNLVGKSFGVLKFCYQGEEYDFSFPRRDEKVARGHRGFDVVIDSGMDFYQASIRRDFTINAMGYDIESQQFLDPYDGMEDITQKRVQHIDDTTFVEDPLRVYRAVQFCARFGYDLHPKTAQLCKDMISNAALDELPKERIYTEWTKLLLKSPKPSIGLELIRELGLLSYFPELQALINLPQSPKWHPEGDVWTHTLMALDAMATLLSDDEKQNIKYMWAILCHDLGKATTTTIDESGNIRSIGHEQAGIVLAQSFMRRLTNEESLIESLIPLIEHHLKPSQFYRAHSKDKAIRRLATKVNLEELVVVAKADFLGRTTPESLAGIYHAGEWLTQKAKSLQVLNKPLPNLLQGRDLIALGLTPSPRFGEILDEIYTLQMDGVLETYEEALSYVTNIKSHISP